jgi:hypothetical protein
MEKRVKAASICASAGKKARGRADYVDQAQGLRDVIEIDRKKALSAKSGRKRDEVFFGTTSVVVPPLKSSEVKRNIKAGQVGLGRALEKIIDAGIELEATKGVPLFHADPAHPGQIIRELNGKRERGVFVKGKFKTIE